MQFFKNMMQADNIPDTVFFNLHNELVKAVGKKEDISSILDEISNKINILDEESRPEAWEIIFGITHEQSGANIIHQACLAFMQQPRQKKDKQSTASDNLNKIDHIFNDLPTKLKEKITNSIIATSSKGTQMTIIDYFDQNGTIFDDLKKSMNTFYLQRPPLLNAVIKNDFNEVESILQKSSDEAGLKKQATNFVRNLFKNDEKVIRQASSKVLYQRDSDGYNALYHAMKNESTDIVKYLFDSGFDLNKKDESGNTELMHLFTLNTINAALSDAQIAALIAPPNSFITNFHVVNQKGQTPLMLAIELGYTKTAMAILNSDHPGKNRRDIDGKTAFDYAVQHDNIEIQKTLIDKAKLNTQDDLGNTPIHNMIIALSENKINQTNVVKAIEAINQKKTNTTDGFKNYITSNNPFIVENSEGKTPLIIAIQQGLTEVALAILDNDSPGADKIYKNHSTFEYACTSTQPGSEKILAAILMKTPISIDKINSLLTEKTNITSANKEILENYSLVMRTSNIQESNNINNKLVTACIAGNMEEIESAIGADKSLNEQILCGYIALCQDDKSKKLILGEVIILFENSFYSISADPQLPDDTADNEDNEDRAFDIIMKNISPSEQYDFILKLIKRADNPNKKTVLLRKLTNMKTPFDLNGGQKWFSRSIATELHLHNISNDKCPGPKSMYCKLLIMMGKNKEISISIENKKQIPVNAATLNTAHNAQTRTTIHTRKPIPGQSHSIHP